MIAGVVRHARTQRDSRALVSHLLKEENVPRVRILGGTLASDLPGAVRDMERLRDASKADAAALHIPLSPSRMMTDDELVRAAEIVIDHLGAQGHPAIIVSHEKERREGDGHRHGHLVLGRVSPEGHVLESGFERIKIETAARIIEHELGEPAILGRHHASAVKWLRAHGRADVADWLEAAHGPNPDRPQSAASPEKRQALARQGVDLSEARATIRDAWTSGGAEAVRSAGFEIKPGRKSGVFVVSQDGIEIGSLDRLTGQKRADVREAMDVAPDLISRKESNPERTQRSRKPVETPSGSPEGDPSSEKSEKFRPERPVLGAASTPLRGKKKAGAEQVSEAAAEQARRFSDAFRARHDDRRTVAAAHHWIKDRRTTLKGAILQSSQSPDDADARRDVARSRRELAVLDAAETALRADPTLAYGGARALMGAARSLHAERTAATRDEIRSAWESGGVVAIRDAGYEIAPGRDGTWRVLREGVPLGAFHRLIGVERDDARRVMEVDVEVAEAVRLTVAQAVVTGNPAAARRHIVRERDNLYDFVKQLALAELDPSWALEEVRSRAQVKLLTDELADLDADPDAWFSTARQSTSSAPDTEKPSKSRQARTSEDAQPSQKPVEMPSGSPEGDPSSGKRRPRRSPEDTLAAAGRFLDRLDANLRGKIAELSCPDRLPEPAELTDARRRLADVADKLATWDARHGPNITELRLQTAARRPMGFFAWLSGSASRYDAASRDLAVVSDERDLLLKPVTAVRREFNILRTAQEVRQSKHDDTRSRERERLSKDLSLVSEAREALAEDPTIALGGRKALAAAARRRQAARLVEEQRAATKLEPVGYTPGYGYGS